MTQPLMIYASNISTGGAWTPTPVQVTPFQFWPNLSEGDDNIAPTAGDQEIPQYLFSSTFFNTSPATTFNCTFTRNWIVAGGSFTATAISVPDTDTCYDLVLTHAADNLYTATLVRTLGNGSTITYNPVISNQVIYPPGVSQWRNAKTIEFSGVTFAENDSLALRTEATNLGISGSTLDTNPAMFTWTLEIYNTNAGSL
jgi:hypothetical protein